MSKLFTYLNTRSFRKNLITAIVSIGVFLLLIFYGLNIYTRHGEGQPVPALKGLQVEEAVKLLEASGFRYQIDSVYLVDKEPGTVIEQDPDPNTNVKKNRTIYLTIITRIAPYVKFPDIQEKTFLEARAILSNYGLKVGDTLYVSGVARDIVVKTSFKGQAIRAGEDVPKGSRINLVLEDGLGASEVDLPNLVGLTLNEARFSLKGASLNLGTISYEGSVTDSINAKIIRQVPAVTDSLNKVTIGSLIDVVLSNE